MAQSRLNKAASIFTRVDGLIKTNLIPYQDRPLWYDVYKAFPPKRDPLYRSILANEDKPKLPSKIFYKEDILRSYYVKNLSPIGVVVLTTNERKPVWEIFIQEYNRLANEGNIPKENLVKEAVAEVKNKGFFIQFIKKSEESKDENEVNETENQSELKLSFKNILNEVLTESGQKS